MISILVSYSLPYLEYAEGPPAALLGGLLQHLRQETIGMRGEEGRRGAAQDKILLRKGSSMRNSNAIKISRVLRRGAVVRGEAELVDHPIATTRNAL